jgi:uncharacterized protein (DUF433 family)
MVLVKNILGMVAGGSTVPQILNAHPELTHEDVTAALEYASQLVDEEKVEILSRVVDRTD